MGIVKDLTNSINDTLNVVPAVVTADALSTVLDLLGFRNGAFLFCIGDSGDTLSGSVYMELELQESDDDSTYTAVADADVRNPVAGATNTGTVAIINAPTEDQVSVWAEYTGTKRYIKANINVTGTHTNGTPCAVVGMRTNPNEQPG